MTDGEKLALVIITLVLAHGLVLFFSLRQNKNDQKRDRERGKL